MHLPGNHRQDEATKGSGSHLCGYGMFGSGTLANIGLEPAISSMQKFDQFSEEKWDIRTLSSHEDLDSKDRIAELAIQFALLGKGKLNERSTIELKDFSFLPIQGTV